MFVCAHTSAEQTSSGTMLIAMAAGVVVVGTPFAQAAELLADGNGVLVPFSDAGAIASAVRCHTTRVCMPPSSQRICAGEIDRQQPCARGEDA